MSFLSLANCKLAQNPLKHIWRFFLYQTVDKYRCHRCRGFTVSHTFVFVIHS
jgi:hypothetical protein